MIQSPAPLTSHGTRHAQVAPIAGALRTLGQLYARAETHVSRGTPRAVLRLRESREAAASGRWHDVPAWRFFRHLVRVGLFLRERCKIAPGDSVLVVAPSRAERIITEWAVVAQGAVVATLDPGTPDDLLACALQHLAPRVVFAADATVARQVRRAGGRAEVLVVIDGAASTDATETTWSAVMDLGGVLDTAERAQTFRAAARAIAPEAPAIAYLDIAAHGSPGWKTASHAAVVDRLVDIWRASPSRPGDVAYVVDPGEYAGLRLAVWALVADGETTLALGLPEREAQEVAELNPDLVVGPTEALERVAQSEREPPFAASSRAADWLRFVALFAPVARRTRRTEHVAPPRRRLLTLEGTSWPVT